VKSRFCRIFGNEFTAHKLATSASGDPKGGIAIKLRNALLEVGGIEGQIAIKFRQKLPFGVSQSSKAIIECVNYASPGLPKASILPVDRKDPIVIRCGIINQNTRLIPGAIVHQYPFRRKVGLSAHRGYRNRQVFFLVPHWCDNSVLIFNHIDLLLGPNHFWAKSH
jgi:hypothetical protein